MGRPLRSRRPELAVLPGLSSLVLHDHDAEVAVLGSILLDGSAVRLVAGSLQPDDFHLENNGEVYAAALALDRGTGHTCAAGRPAAIDIATLSAEPEHRGSLNRVGGRAALALLQEETPTAANIEHYARVV